MRRLIISGGLLLTFAVSLTAQKINQSVQVTNDYETRFADFKKSEPDLVLPDSLYAFDYSFDYSVFDSPYKGSYEFTPYNVEIARYSVPFAMNLYASLLSYFEISLMLPPQ